MVSSEIEVGCELIEKMVGSVWTVSSIENGSAVLKPDNNARYDRIVPVNTLRKRYLNKGKPSTNGLVFETNVAPKGGEVVGDLNLGLGAKHPWHIEVDVNGPVSGIGLNGTQRRHAHYFKDVERYSEMDTYLLCRVWKIQDDSGALHHALKKLLDAGKRGSKNKIKDVAEARDTLNRYLEIEEMFADEQA